MKNLLLVILVLAASSCGKKNDETKSEIAVAPKDSAQAQVSEQDCFDRKMDTWFVAFNKYQERGDDMSSADKKALQDAEDEFLKCQGTARLSTDEQK